MKTYSLKTGSKVSSKPVDGTGTSRAVKTSQAGTEHGLVSPETAPVAKDAKVGGTINSRYVVTTPGLKQNIGDARPLESNSPSIDDQNLNTRVYAVSRPRRSQSL